MSNCGLPSGVIDQIRRNPAHEILLELGQSARDMNLHTSIEFRKLIAYLLELADGRDRREPWTTRPGIARPVPKLRVALDKCFGQYADLQWFRLNKTTNTSGMPLVGLYPRTAAGLARVEPESFGSIVEALVEDNPDPALMRLLHRCGGKIKGVGVELLSRIAHAYRRDMYFVIQKSWGEASGILRFIDGDLRKYCALCRTLRSVCDQVGISPELRGSVFDRLMEKDPPPDELRAVLHRAVGPTLARFQVLEPGDAYEPRGRGDDEAAMPLEFASRAIRARRGKRQLREKLIQAHGQRCAITGACPVDLLEVAYVVPFPDGDVHTVGNAILLRSDLHTLWDLDLIVLDPETLAVQVSPRLKGSIYENIAGRKITERPGAPRLSRDGLRERWTAFAGETPSRKGRDAQRHRPESAPTITVEAEASGATARR